VGLVYIQEESESEAKSVLSIVSDERNATGQLKDLVRDICRNKKMV
jgi:hypothetical protein